MIRLFDIPFSDRFRDFSCNKPNFCVRLKKITVRISRSRVNFRYTSGVPGQKVYQKFGKLLQGV